MPGVNEKISDLTSISTSASGDYFPINDAGDLGNSPKSITVNDLLDGIPVDVNIGTAAANLGAEKVTNGDFATDSDWTKGANWTISGGKASKSSGAINNLSQDISAVAKETYKITYTISNVSGGNFYIEAGSVAGNEQGSNGTFTEYIIAKDTDDLKFVPVAAATTFDLDDVSVKKILAGALIVSLSGTFRNEVNVGLATIRSPGRGNIGFGEGVLSNLESGHDNTAFGGDALLSCTTGEDNTAYGKNALAKLTSGFDNVAVGEQALPALTTASANVAIGTGVLSKMTTEDANTAIGHRAMELATTGKFNVAVGLLVLRNATGGFNTGVGTGTLGALTSGTENTTVGYLSLDGNTDGDQNVGVGNSTLRDGTSINRNTAIGYRAGRTATGNDNVFLGHQAGYYETGNDKLFIDNAIRADEADARLKALMYGVFADDPDNQELNVNANLRPNGFYPRRISQSAQPTSGTSASQIDTGEMIVWRDPDDNKTYLVFNDTDEGVRKSEMI